MKSLIQYIHEHLVLEGGNSVENAGPIPGNKAKEVAETLITLLKDKFGCNCCPLGSVGKKGKNQMSGDIDIAIETSWDKDFNKIYKYVESNLDNVSSMGNVNKQLHVFNFGYKWDKEHIVQVDFMFVDDLEFAEFVYHSPDFTKNESKYKGMYQSALLMATAKALHVDIKGNDGPPEDGEAKEWYEYHFTQTDGLKLVKKSNVGKNGKPIKTPKKLEEKIITKKVNEILMTILGNKATKEDCNSFESLVSYLSSNKFDHHEVLNNIVKNFMNDWQIKLKTSDELMKELENYMKEKFEI